jgi:hypothetical protein
MYLLKEKCVDVCSCGEFPKGLKYEVNVLFASTQDIFVTKCNEYFKKERWTTKVYIEDNEPKLNDDFDSFEIEQIEVD